MISSPVNPNTIALVWLRTQLRLADNTCLYHALNENETVYLLYVLDDTYMKGEDIGAARGHFLLESLKELQATVETYGGQLIVRRVKSEVPQEVVRVMKEVGAARLYHNRDYLPYPLARDARTKELADAEGIEVRTYQDALLVEPHRILTEEGRPYSVFTPFKRRWESLLDTPERYKIEELLPRLKVAKRAPSAGIPALSEYGLTLTQSVETPGEKQAVFRLEHFVNAGLPTYHQQRDNMSNPDGTSRLSPHLKWGTISLRECYRQAREQNGPGADKWIDELAWREFFYSIMFHFPHVLTGPMLPEYNAFPWSDDTEHLEAWKAGQTGYPLVDAGMRQLNATGWMHNRLRQVTASYLCKDLRINWQEGERYFMQKLTCGDWPSNNGGWQWVAGTGTDPRRATRIFNPILQQERYDPQMEFVRQWVPEIGTSKYPKPIVAHAEGIANFMKAFADTATAREVMRTERREEAERHRKAHRKSGKEEGLTGKLWD